MRSLYFHFVYGPLIAEAWRAAQLIPDFSLTRAGERTGDLLVFPFTLSPSTAELQHLP
jgi:hypothetical protein